jgi:hypothetical protein
MVILYTCPPHLTLNGFIMCFSHGQTRSSPEGFEASRDSYRPLTTVFIERDQQRLG